MVLKCQDQTPTAKKYEGRGLILRHRATGQLEVCGDFPKKFQTFNVSLTERRRQEQTRPEPDRTEATGTNKTKTHSLLFCRQKLPNLSCFVDLILEQNFNNLKRKTEKQLLPQTYLGVSKVFFGVPGGRYGGPLWTPPLLREYHRPRCHALFLSASRLIHKRCNFYRLSSVFFYSLRVTMVCLYKRVTELESLQKRSTTRGAGSQEQSFQKIKCSQTLKNPQLD